MYQPVGLVVFRVESEKMVTDVPVLVVNTFPYCSYNVVTTPNKNYGNCRTHHTCHCHRPDTVAASL